MRIAARILIGLAIVALVGAVFSAATYRPRALIVGDSITAQYGPWTAGVLHSHGFATELRAYPGAGLLDRGPRINVLETLRTDVDETHPAIVIAEFSGNYGILDPALPG